MKRVISEVAKLMLYNGPSVDNIIVEAIEQGNWFDVIKSGNITQVIVVSTTAYDLKVKDTYCFDADGKLVKQVTAVNGTEKIIFDKYVEANTLLKSLDCQLSYQVS